MAGGEICRVSEVRRVVAPAEVGHLAESGPVSVRSEVDLEEVRAEV